MEIGSESHKELFCQSFMTSHRQYEPEHLPWPDLDDVTLNRLRGIPFWSEALNTEQQAGAMLNAYAAKVDDPMLQAAIALQGMEESRHAQVISTLVKQYGLQVTSSTDNLSDSSELAFTRFGYGECFDAFFAFGLFEIARQSGFVPQPLLTIFDPILDEEARHMVFFVNWVAYQQVNRGRGARPIRGLHSLWHYSGSLRRRLNSFRGSRTNSAGSGKGFTASGASAVTANLTPEKFLSICLQENSRRMSFYDNRLLRPQVMPAIASFALNSLKRLPKQSVTPNKIPG